MHVSNFFPSSLSLKCALRESGCRIGYEPTKMSRDHFWLSISRDTNLEVSALSPCLVLKTRNELEMWLSLLLNLRKERVKWKRMTSNCQ